MEVTKAQAAQILGCSIKKVFKMIKNGELTARKKGDSKFSDWIITLPDAKATQVFTNEKAVGQAVHAALPPIEVVTTPEGKTVAVVGAPEDAEEVKELAQEIKEEKPVSGGAEDSAKAHEKENQPVREEPKEKEEPKSVEESSGREDQPGSTAKSGDAKPKSGWWF